MALRNIGYYPANTKGAAICGQLDLAAIGSRLDGAIEIGRRARVAAP
jgi:hypothetical protein